jgi:endonuclease/exonuclease/phosphatase family metal-dependent hydrolase
MSGGSEEYERSMALIGRVEPPDLHCMTLNLRRDVGAKPGSADDWQERRQAVAAVVTEEEPSLLAVQEALPRQSMWLAQTLGTRWQPVLVGRGRKQDGEQVGMFIDTTRLAVIERRSWSLSPSPLTPGRRAWGSIFPRNVVGAILQDLATEERFLALVTHLDHLSPWSRYRSAELILRIADGRRELPAVALGDWNADAGSAPYRVLTEGGFVDSWRRASSQMTEEYGTFPHYGEPRIGGRRLDWILTRGAIVSQAAISAVRPSGRWPSDHMPVQAVIRWGEL